MSSLLISFWTIPTYFLHFSFWFLFSSVVNFTRFKFWFTWLTLLLLWPTYIFKPKYTPTANHHLERTNYIIAEIQVNWHMRLFMTIVAIYIDTLTIVIKILFPYWWLSLWRTKKVKEKWWIGWSDSHLCCSDSYNFIEYKK